MTQQILRLPAVKARTGLSRSTVYAMMREGTFPLCVRLGARSIGWQSNLIDSWISSRVASRSVRTQS